MCILEQLLALEVDSGGSSVSGEDNQADGSTESKPEPVAASSGSASGSSGPSIGLADNAATRDLAER